MLRALESPLRPRDLLTGKKEKYTQSSLSFCLAQICVVCPKSPGDKFTWTIYLLDRGIVNICLAGFIYFYFFIIVLSSLYKERGLQEAMVAFENKQIFFFFFTE